VTDPWHGQCPVCRYRRRHVTSFRAFLARHAHARLALAWYRWRRRRAVPLMAAARLRALPRSPLAAVVTGIAAFTALLVVLSPPGGTPPRCHPAGPHMTCVPPLRTGYPGRGAGP
jgi:hypothetical protein